MLYTEDGLYRGKPVHRKGDTGDVVTEHAMQRKDVADKGPCRGRSMQEKERLRRKGCCSVQRTDYSVQRKNYSTKGKVRRNLPVLCHGVPRLGTACSGWQTNAVVQGRPSPVVLADAAFQLLVSF